MLSRTDIQKRRPVWIALSELYLDAKLQEDDYERIATVLLDSPYSLDEVKRIDKYEVFPVLQANLLGEAGMWTSFDEDWLLDAITLHLSKMSGWKRFGVQVHYWRYKGLWTKAWAKVEKAYNGLRVVS